MMPGGLFRHYKGDLYRVISAATESTNARNGQLLVIYIGRPASGIRVRTLEEWQELVVWPDGTMRPRFTLADQAPNLGDCE